MSDFSEMLCSIMERDSVNGSKMAESLGMDRGVMAKYKNGKRLPEKQIIVERMADYLMLPINDRKQFIEVYKKSLNPDTYARRKAVLDFIRLFQDPNDRLPKAQFEYNPGDLTGASSIASVRGVLSVRSVIKRIMSNEGGRRNAQVRMLVDASNNELMNVISMVLSEFPEMVVHHVVQVDKFYLSEEKKAINSLQVLSLILNQCFVSSNYHSYVEYTNPEVQGFSPLFQSIIITSEYCLAFNSDLTKGILCKEKEVVDMQQEMFDEKMSGCMPYLVCENDPYKIMALHSESIYSKDREREKNDLSEKSDKVRLDKKDGRGFVLYSSLPCILPQLSFDMVQNYINKDIENWKDLLELFNKYRIDVGNMLKQDNALMIMSVTGIKEFLETGVIDELPPRYYKLLPEVQRYQLIKRFLNNTPKERIRVLKNDMSLNKAGLRISASPRSMVIEFINNEDLTYIVTRERMIVEAFYDTLSNLDENMFYSQEEGYRYLTESAKQWAVDHHLIP